MEVRVPVEVCQWRRGSGGVPVEMGDISRCVCVCVWSSCQMTTDMLYTKMCTAKDRTSCPLKYHGLGDICIPNWSSPALSLKLLKECLLIRSSCSLQGKGEFGKSP